MATMTAPRKRPRMGRRWIWIALALIAIVIIGIIAVGALNGGAQATAGTPGWVTEAVANGAIEASISATGNVAPQAQAELRFTGDGTVMEILVKPGDTVKAGQPLARIDQVDAQLKLEAAQADYEQAKAGYDKLKAGSTPEEIKDAQAKLAQAQASYDQTLAKVSNADVVAARARLEQAQVQLNQIRSSPVSTDMRDAEAQFQRAQIALQSERDRLSQAKTNAQLQMDRAVADLSRVQQNYATAKQNWDFVNQTGQDPTNPESSDPSKPGEKIPNKLSDTQRQQYYDSFVSAEANLRNAESTVRQAQVDFDAARQAETTGVQTAEQQLASAQASRDKVRGGEPATLAEARASVASAQADLNRLIGTSRASDLAAAQTNIEAAQLALDKLSKGANAYDLAKAQSDVARAETTMKQLQRALNQTSLSSRFDATVARIDLRIGEQAGVNGIIAVVDMRSFHIDLPIDELDVTQVQAGQTVRITLDALVGKEFTGKVTTISPLAVKNDKGSNTYAVTVELDGADAMVRPGMTASVQVVTTRKEGVVLAPRRAIQTENGQTFVYVPSAKPTTPQPQAAGPGAIAPPPGERRAVKLGLSNSDMVEVVSGLATGEKVYVPDVVQTFNPFAN